MLTWNDTSAHISCPPGRRLMAACLLGFIGLSLIGLVLWSPEILPGRPDVVKDLADCGPRSLQTILGRHGLDPPFADITACTGLSAAGTSMLGLRDCARSYGLEAEGWLVPAGDLGRIPLPAIVFLDGHHFAVLDAVEGERVRLTDPDAGEVLLTTPGFLRRWKGYTLVVQPQNR